MHTPVAVTITTDEKLHLQHTIVQANYNNPDINAKPFGRQRMYPVIDIPLSSPSPKKTQREANFLSRKD
jgi:hypothetical protein